MREGEIVFSWFCFLVMLFDWYVKKQPEESGKIIAEYLKSSPIEIMLKVALPLLARRKPSVSLGSDRRPGGT
jgi:hypothetical protein